MEAKLGRFDAFPNIQEPGWQKRSRSRRTFAELMLLVANMKPIFHKREAGS